MRPTPLLTSADDSGSVARRGTGHVVSHNGALNLITLRYR